MHKMSIPGFCMRQMAISIFIKNSQIIMKEGIEFFEKSDKIATVLRRTLIKRRKLS